MTLRKAPWFLGREQARLQGLVKPSAQRRGMEFQLHLGKGMAYWLQMVMRMVRVQELARGKRLPLAKGWRKGMATGQGK